MKKAVLVLDDGSSYAGFSFGAERSSSGEVVFNTGMVGYPESLTDPSYRGQILVSTYPLMGNYGIPQDTFESDNIQVAGFVVSEFCQNPSHNLMHMPLASWLITHSIPAIYGVDTRALAKRLRERGVMLGKIVIGEDIQFEDPNKRNLVAEVSTPEKKIYGSGKRKILLVDCGVKNNIIRNLLRRDCTVIRVPWNYDFLQEDYDALFISNGPGDPSTCKETITNVAKALQKDKPIFGICLGSQILALAAGAKTYKLKYGHRGQNQPCLLTGSKKSYITSQNHGFAVDEKTLPEGWRPWFINLNDNTNEGIRHLSKPFMAVQFHPESSPGPTDTEFLFDEFIGAVK